MSLIQRVTALAQAVAADIKALYIGKAEKEHTHTVDQVSGLGTAATTNNGTDFGQNIINSAVAGDGNISYSGTLQNNTTGSGNTAAGSYALQDNTTGQSNTAYGMYALQSITTGHYNTASGTSALRWNLTGHNNTAYGSYALHSNREGGFNTAVGANALTANRKGSHNTAVGTEALRDNREGGNNTAVGSKALQNNLSGHNNTASGANALQWSSYDNCGGFGHDSQVTGSNQIQLGDSSTTVYAYGAVQNRSDARDKAEIRDTVLGLDFINAIRPVDYKLDMREDYRVELGENPTEEQLESNKLANIQTDGTHTRKRYHHGVIAQEVAETMEALGVDFGGFQDHSKNGGDDVLSIGYEEFIAPLIKAVQELSARVKELEMRS